VIRNRAYLGEIYYRGNWYPAPHEPLIPTELFEKAQAILTERCEDRSKRAANPAEYLLTGRVRCGRCGQAYVGTAAHGRNGRYTYYTCSHARATAPSTARTTVSLPNDWSRPSPADSGRCWAITT
jgi:site-specific DNA recombinase